MIRFSYPALSGFGKTPGETGAAEAFLYDAARLKRRFHLFERLCLPALLRQTDPRFSLVFLTGERFPAEAETRLRDLIAPLRDARIVRAGPMHNYPATKAGFAALPPGDHSHRTTFRLDDDDALSVHHVARLRAVAARLHQPDRPRDAFAVAWTKGLYLVLDEGGNDVFDVVERLPLGLGLSLTVPIDRPGNVYLHHHRRIGEDRDLWQNSSQLAFIRSVHRDNDAGLNLNGVRDRMDRDRIAAALRADFAVSLDDLMAV